MKLTTEQKDYILSRKPTLWIKEYDVKNEQGLAIDFYNHLYLYDLYNDFSPLQVIPKAGQVGFSTTAIIKTLLACNYKKMDAIYTLPTVADVHQFVGGKVNRIIAQNPILQSWVKDKDSVDQKSVGDNLIYYRGTYTERAAIMVSSDLNVYDEVDRSKQDVVDQYHSRLQHSKHKMEWYFSNPSVPNNGVDKYWQRSDQMHWFIKCSRCNYRQYLKWPDSIDMDKQIYVCRSCHQQLRDEDRRVGQWVNKYVLGSQDNIDGKTITRDFRGYWISLLMTPWTKASEIIKLNQTKSGEFFFNFVLGLPYVGNGNVVTQDVLFRNLTSEIIQPVDEQNERIVIGVDTGTTIYYVLGNNKGLFYYGSCTDYEEIERLLMRYKRSIAVFDQGGDLIMPRKLREKYPGRVFLCHYSVDRKTMQLVRWGESDEAGNVIVDRNRMIQLVIDEFSDKRIGLQGGQADWHDYWLHWKNIYRVKELNRLNVEETRWERSGDDHWVHATVYWRTGMDKFGVGSGKVLVSNSFLNSVPVAPTVIDGKVPLIMQKIDQEEGWRNT